MNQRNIYEKKITVSELLKRHPDGILVDNDTIRKGVLFRNASILKNANSWHAFIVHNVNNPERNIILKIILDHLYPLDLIPVKFESHGNDCMFMARNCTEAIEKLCKDNLLIPNLSDPMLPLRLEIILQFSTLHKVKVDVQKNITSVLHTLFNPTTKTLNLDNFAENSDLSEYCPLSQPKIMYFVLHIALGIHPICIQLTNNDIHSLFPMEALWSSTSLTKLDLRNNRIDHSSSLDTLKMIDNITEIWLDGNPLCNDRDEYSYIAEMKKLLPKLEKLDGVPVTQGGFPASRINSLCNSDGFNLVDQFVEYYFPLYDSNRKLLEGLYHPKAMCSITNLYKNSQTTSSSAKLRPYQMNSRNLLAMADISRSQQFLIRGNSCIIRKLVDLPLTEHDPCSFNLDLIYYSGTCAVIVVTGLFREVPEALLEPERYLGFQRTFVLTGINGEYSITNDMLHVYNALSHQAAKAFTITKTMKTDVLPTPTTFKEKEKAIEAVQMITGVNREWSSRLLENANFEISACLRTFVDLFKVDKVPKEAFVIQ